MGFKEIKPAEIDGNALGRVGSQWMLITAQNREGKVNAMTASWGALGVLWNRPVGICYIRPQRYTKEFVDASERFTFSFLPEKYRSALNLLGSKSGRESDKITEAGLHIVRDGEAAYFEEAELALVNRKIYLQYLDPAGFIDPSIAKNYPLKDYHCVYVGEIEKCLKAE